MFPLLLAVSYLGKSSRPKWGAGVLAVAKRPMASAASQNEASPGASTSGVA